MGVIIRAKHIHCISGTTGNHFSVKKNRINGSVSIANNDNDGITKKTTTRINLSYTETIRSRSS